MAVGEHRELRVITVRICLAECAVGFNQDPLDVIQVDLGIGNSKALGNDQDGPSTA